MEKLKIGDKIGLIAPSSNPKNAENIGNIAKLIKDRGFIPVFSSDLINQNNDKKIRDINNLFSDKEVKAIFTIRGGFSCNEILDSIDYKIIKDNKKIFVGFSDITNLLIAFNKKSNLKTIHGPIFSEKEYFDESLLNIFFSFITGKIDLDDILIKMNFSILKNSKKTNGELIGGNLFVLNNLIGTKYEPNWEDKILFIESTGLSKEIIISIVHHFKQIGIFNKVKGLIIGNLGCSENISNNILSKLDNFKGFIIITNYIGHVVNNLPITIGEKVEWNGNCLVTLNADK